MGEYTPIPWSISDVGIGFEIEALVDGKLSVITQTQQVRSNDRVKNHEERRANAEFIVQAVNSREIYEEALCRIAAIDGPSKQKEIAREALEKAGSHE